MVCTRCSTDTSERMSPNVFTLIYTPLRTLINILFLMSSWDLYKQKCKMGYSDSIGAPDAAEPRVATVGHVAPLPRRNPAPNVLPQLFGSQYSYCYYDYYYYYYSVCVFLLALEVESKPSTRLKCTHYRRVTSGISAATTLTSRCNTRDCKAAPALVIARGTRVALRKTSG